jgi:hypothetical protein
MKGGEQTAYTTIRYSALWSLGISLNEYCFADIIHNLSRQSGWCYAKRKTLAEQMCLTERGIRKIITRLVEEGLVEKKGKLIRTTEKWRNAVILSSNRNKVPVFEGKNDEKRNLVPVSEDLKAEHRSGFDEVYIEENNRLEKVPNGTCASGAVVPVSKETNIGVAKIITFFRETKLSPNLGYNNSSQREAAKWILENHSFEEMVKVIADLEKAKSNGKEFVPLVSSPWDFREKYHKIKDFYQRTASKKGYINVI